MPSASRTKERLDQHLVRVGLAESRERAKRLILAGEVRVGTEVLDKPSTMVLADAEVSVKERPKYVGRGGLKLEGALDTFGIDPQGKVCFDAGASTGGFTDCLLQKGAAKVYAYDVGTNQLVWKLRSDPRVVVREKFNVRHMVPEDVGEMVDLVVLDVSFISLTLILPTSWKILKPTGSVVCLIKPQFELARDDVGKGGIVRDPELRERAVAKIQQFAETSLQAHWRDVIDSPITGTDGNHEYLAWLQPT
ncbi:MAG: 23S rRNA (cytidine1920-2'-O)/16S rRNA (cytidine1409-2'-O)-methyltransferase [Verrucomicrobiales bacterium]|jgi:23S rRNA (cytidine1920-2'-O)/16S rRNA (cytidine1409-2'-O)-methyltransferase